MDINEYRLKEITRCVERIKRDMGSNIRITPTLSREEALTGADAVVCTVFKGDVDVWRHEIEIPMKYGVNINVGDTRSVSGIFRALRNIPLMLDITREVVKAVNIPVTVKTRLGWDADNKIIVELAEQQQKEKISEIQGEQKDNGWGSQIRSYVFQPYTMAKDLRTGYEMGNIGAVMDGEIDGFINAYLKSLSLGQLEAK